MKTPLCAVCTALLLVGHYAAAHHGCHGPDAKPMTCTVVQAHHPELPELEPAEVPSAPAVAEIRPAEPMPPNQRVMSGPQDLPHQSGSAFFARSA